MSIQMAYQNAPINKLISVQSFESDGKLKILRGYFGGGFQVNDEFVSGSIILYPRKLLNCPISSSSEISQELLDPHIKDIKPDMLLVGVGDNPTHLYQPLRNYAKQVTIGIDIMSTSSACRTWNVLLSEGRNVVACLIAVP